MITWVDAACRQWGSHKRWMITGEQGWPERSILGRLIDEGPGAGHESAGTHCPIKDPPEAYTLVSVALQRMAATQELDKPLQVVRAHYVLRGNAKQKAPWLGMSVRQYWNYLNNAQSFIAAFAPTSGDIVPRGTESRVA
jgi:hypothetical protein